MTAQATLSQRVYKKGEALRGESKPKICNQQMSKPPPGVPLNAY